MWWTARWKIWENLGLLSGALYHTCWLILLTGVKEICEPVSIRNLMNVLGPEFSVCNCRLAMFLARVLSHTNKFYLYELSLLLAWNSVIRFFLACYKILARHHALSCTWLEFGIKAVRDWWNYATYSLKMCAIESALFAFKIDITFVSYFQLHFSLILIWYLPSYLFLDLVWSQKNVVAQF